MGTSWFGGRRFKDIVRGEDANVDELNVDGAGSNFKINNVAMTATAAELNALASTGLSAAELAYLDGVTAGTVSASKAVVVDANKAVNELGIQKEFILAYNDTGSTISKGDLVTFVGAHTNGQPKIVLADANVADRRAEGAVQADILTAASGVVILRGLSPATLNTNSATSAGDPAFLGETPGGPTYAEETETDEISQRVGYVVTKSATVGQLYYNFRIDEIAPTDVQGTAIIADTLTTKGDLYAATAASTVARLAAGTDGKALIANAGATAGVGYAWVTDRVPAVFRDQGTLKAANFPPDMLTTSSAMTDGALVFTAVYLPYAATITGVVFIQDVQGDYVADNNNKVGLYTTSGGTLTQVATSADDGTMWKAAADTVVQEAFTGTYAAAAGLYFIAYLWNTSDGAPAAVPQLASPTAQTAARIGCTTLLTNNVKAHSFIAAQTDLPATQAWTGVSSSNVAFMGLY